jgi:uncharacterized membrane protein
MCPKLLVSFYVLTNKFSVVLYPLHYLVFYLFVFYSSMYEVMSHYSLNLHFLDGFFFLMSQ